MSPSARHYRTSSECSTSSSATTKVVVEPASVPVVTNNSLTFTPYPASCVRADGWQPRNLERFFDTINDPAVSDVVLTPAAFANASSKLRSKSAMVLAFARRSRGRGNGEPKHAPIAGSAN